MRETGENRIGRVRSIFPLLGLFVFLTIPRFLSADEARFGKPLAKGLIYPGELVSTSDLLKAGGHFHSFLLTTDLAKLFAGTHVGLFKSLDRGLTWELVAPRFIGEEVQGIAGDTVTGVLYVATRNMGLQVSRDWGDTWTGHASRIEGRDIRAVALGPGRPGVIYASAAGRGLFRSDDGGSRWSQVTDKRALPAVASLAVHPERVEQLYAGTATGVWLSIDGGYNWSRPSGGLRHGTSVVSPQPGPTDRLFAVTRKGMFVGKLDGTSWTRLSRTPWGTPTALAFLADRPGQVFVMTHEGVVAAQLPGTEAWALITELPP
ncbi:MAG TPA: hypothetical protein VJO34_00655 [Methylomirabilota bacterium]|nr:hypothetical protein [Methylomirabilota bacterium]